MRDKMNAEEIEASRTLDLLRAGVHVNEAIVTRALYVLGDLVGLKEFDDDGGAV